IGEPSIGFDDQNFAVGNTIPVPHGLGAEVESVTHHRLEVVLHEPLLDQRALGESAPDFLRRMRHLPFDDEGTHGGSFGHWSILFNRFSRRSKWSRQKAP